MLTYREYSITGRSVPPVMKGLGNMRCVMCGPRVSGSRRRSACRKPSASKPEVHQALLRGSWDLVSRL